jgi:hypothetical protein
VHVHALRVEQVLRGGFRGRVKFPQLDATKYATPSLTDQNPVDDRLEKIERPLELTGGDVPTRPCCAPVSQTCHLTMTTMKAAQLAHDGICHVHHRHHHHAPPHG